VNAFAATGENPINYIVRHMTLVPGATWGDVDVPHGVRPPSPAAALPSTCPPAWP